MSCCKKCKKIMKVHFRGIIGGLGIFACILFLIITAAVSKDLQNMHSIVIKILWVCMFWSFLWQPFDAPVTGLIPIFFSPMTGDMATGVVLNHYFSDSIALYLFMRIIGQVMSQSGADRRIITILLSCGSVKCFSLYRMIWRVSFTTFLMSVFTNRQMSTPIIMDYVCGPIESLEASMAIGKDPDYKKVRYMLATLTHTSSTIGSLFFIHSAPSMLFFRAAITQSAAVHYPDVFNYLRYTSFGGATAIVMYFFNVIYHLILTSIAIKRNMSTAAMTSLRKHMRDHRENVPALWKGHEILAILFTITTLLMLMFRFPVWFDGWTKSNLSVHVPVIQDTTVAAISILLLHLLPTNLNFLKVLSAQKKSDLPPQKATIGLLEWRFVDKKCNYPYMFLFGGSLALLFAFASGICYVGKEISTTLNALSNMHPMVTIFILMFLTVILCNVMTGVAAAACIMPIAMYLHTGWTGANTSFFLMKPYIAPLAISLASCLGFLAPFVNTPAFYSRAFGRVPIIEMIKWGIGSVIICFFILLTAVFFYAPIVFGEFPTSLKGK